MSNENKYLNWLCDHSAEILTSISVICGVAAPILTTRATIKAVRALDAKEVMRLGADEYLPPMTKKEQVAAVWKYYVAPSAVTMLGVGCSIGAGVKNANVISGLSSAYSTAVSSAQMLDSVVKARVPEDAYAKIKTELAEKQIEALPEPRVVESKNTTQDDLKDWYRDAWSNQEFRMSMEDLKSIRNDFQERQMAGDSVTLFDYYNRLPDGVRPTDYSESLGWQAYVYSHKLFDWSIIPTVRPDGGTISVISFDVMPTELRRG